MAVCENQAFLLVVCDYGDTAIISTQGEVARWLKSRDAWIFDNLPESKGMYVWEGCCEIRWSATGFWEDVDIDGSWRPALLNDFVRFGLPVPLPRLPEGVLA
jgi:hypothetical protein